MYYIPMKLANGIPLVLIYPVFRLLILKYFEKITKWFASTLVKSMYIMYLIIEYVKSHCILFIVDNFGIFGSNTFDYIVGKYNLSINPPSGVHHDHIIFGNTELQYENDTLQYENDTLQYRYTVYAHERKNGLILNKINITNEFICLSYLTAITVDLIKKLHSDCDSLTIIKVSQDKKTIQSFTIMLDDSVPFGLIL